MTIRSDRNNVVTRYLTGLVGEVRLKVCIMHCVLLVEGAILHGNWKGCNKEHKVVPKGEHQKTNQSEGINLFQRTINEEQFQSLQLSEITSYTKHHIVHTNINDALPMTA